MYYERKHPLSSHSASNRRYGIPSYTAAHNDTKRVSSPSAVQVRTVTRPYRLRPHLPLDSGLILVILYPNSVLFQMLNIISVCGSGTFAQPNAHTHRDTRFATPNPHEIEPKPTQVESFHLFVLYFALIGFPDKKLISPGLTGQKPVLEGELKKKKRSMMAGHAARKKSQLVLKFATPCVVASFPSNNTNSPCDRRRRH